MKIKTLDNCEVQFLLRLKCHDLNRYPVCYCLKCYLFFILKIYRLNNPSLNCLKCKAQMTAQ